MGSCMTRFGDPNGRVLWYTANSPESLEWQTKKTGFGYRRDKSFLEAALDREGYTRMGNSTGGLAGKLLVYQKAESDMDYSSIPESPTIRFKDGEKLFAKAFLKVPLGRTPIGENNYIPSDDPRGQGATLLASRPRVIAIYLDVDGKPQVNEHFCSYSKDDFNGRLENFDPKPKTLTEALPGSFFTYMCCPEQDPYCFLHFPLVGSLSDTTFKTGVYGESLVRCFCDLLVQLDPGIHQFDIKVKYAYDHSDYNCLILGEGTNALGRWYKKISNNKLISPHEDPEVLETPDEAVACGTFMLDLMRRYANTMVDQLDRKPPPELYFSQDAEQLRRIARTVAAGRFCPEHDLSGLPEWVVLTSDLTTTVETDDEYLSYSYESIDFAAMWVNDADPTRPDAIGTIIEGTMGRGEVAPNFVSEHFVFVSKKQNGEIIPPKKRAIKNKDIHACTKGRRVSVG